MLLPFFQWCEASFVGQMIRQSLWLFPVVEAVHLLGLAVIGGAILIVDLRMLGIGLRQPIAVIARDARPWLVGSIVVMLVTGISLFLSESVKCYYSQAFWLKITTLPVAIAYTFAVRQPLAVRAEHSSIRTRLVALISMALWFTVGAAGRWIGFS
jgi:Family of unknown function (DUF6644)